MKLPKSKRKELRKQLAEAGVEKKSRRRTGRAVRSEWKEAGNEKPKMTFNFAVGDLVRLPKNMGGHTVMLIEDHNSGHYFRFMDPNSLKLVWVRGKEIRPA